MVINNSSWKSWGGLFLKKHQLCRQLKKLVNTHHVNSLLETAS
ncbi:hypothetical protein [uncultured Gammaproteobacteria bacterium]|nr:hypothetical protein [uncultured Gammaproteobacteria bacterium]